MLHVLRRLTISINDIPAPSAVPGVWPLRLRSEPGLVKLESTDKQTALISYRLRPERHRGLFDD